MTVKSNEKKEPETKAVEPKKEEQVRLDQIHCSIETIQNQVSNVS